MAGKGNCKNKTPLPEQERNEESCEKRRHVVAVAIVVEPVVVPVPRAVVVAVEVQEVPVAVLVPQKCMQRRLLHCPSNTLRAVSNSTS